MKRLGAIGLVVALIAASCAQAWTEKNWAGGSCVHASLVMAMRVQGRDDLAAQWRKSHSGGETWYSTRQHLQRARVPYADTHDANNLAFIKWACENQLSVVVGVTVKTWGGGTGYHAVLVVEFNDDYVKILDNNHTEAYRYIPTADFVRNWYAAGSWAVTPVLKPVPAPPRDANYERVDYEVLPVFDRWFGVRR